MKHPKDIARIALGMAILNIPMILSAMNGFNAFPHVLFLTVCVAFGLYIIILPDVYTPPEYGDDVWNEERIAKFREERADSLDRVEEWQVTQFSEMLHARTPLRANTTPF